jgi:predicted glycoside hydrolase/deacetylase ChbG (UPF0249 family)
VTDRRLVVTADDFGLSPAVNEGVVAAHTGGIVTSASLMVRRRCAPDAARRAAQLPELSLGLHVELASYSVVDGAWITDEVVADPSDRAAVEAELADQVRRFESLVGRSPSHLDSHHHLHREEPAASVVLAMAERLGVPVRDDGSWTYRGDFYGQFGAGIPWPEGVTPHALVTILGTLAPGVSELACHPASAPDPAHGTYDRERVVELASLCDPAVRAEIDRRGIALIGADGRPQPKRPDT